jgi:hypothetical protein
MNPKLQEILKHCKDKNTLREVISRVIPISELMDAETEHNLYCPFHDDEGGGKPSAKIYRHDQDGVEKLWCYSEGRFYTSYDYITLVEEGNPMSTLMKQDNLPDLKPIVQDIQNQQENFRQEQAKEIRELARKNPSFVSFFDKLYEV